MIKLKIKYNTSLKIFKMIWN